MEQINLIFIIVALAAIFINEANSLHCWRCNSDASNDHFCNDPFDASSAPYTLEDCSRVSLSFVPPNAKTVCKKNKTFMNGRTIISRQCDYVQYGETECREDFPPPAVRTTYCSICDTDGCNGAQQYGPIIISMLAPILLVRLITL